MARRIARLARFMLLWALPAAVLGLLTLAVVAYAALSRTKTGRAFVRDLALEQANGLFRGRLDARELSELGVTAVALRGVTVSDPTGVRVIEAESLVLELSPLALLSGELHVDRVAIENARVDLADLGTERGVIAAFALRQPSRPSAPEPDFEPPMVVVDAIELDAIAVSAKVPELGVVRVEALAARASFALRNVASVKLSSLSTRLVAANLVQPVRVALTASGTLDALDGRVQLSSAAGDVVVHAKLLDRGRLELHASSRGVTPSALWAGAPDQRIAFELTGIALIAERALRDLSVHAQWRGVKIELSGDASAEALDLQGTVRARDFEHAETSVRALNADFTAVGPPTAPHASVALLGTGLRYQNIAIDRVALTASGGPRRYQVSLDASAPDGQVQLTTQMHIGEHAVELDTSARGALRKRPFSLQVQRARIGFGGSIAVERAVLEGLGQRLLAHGSYGAAERDLLELDGQLDLTTLSDALALEPRLRGRANVKLRASGTVARPQAELRVRAQNVGVREPVREGPTVDVVLTATLDTKRGELSAKAEIKSGRELELGTQLTARFNPRKLPWHRELLERPELTLTTQGKLRHGKRADTYELAFDARYAAASVELALTARDEQGPWVHASAALEHPAETLEQFLAPGAALLHEATWSAELELSPRALGTLPLDALIQEPVDPQLSAITAGLSLDVAHAPHAEPIASAALRVFRPARGTAKVRVGFESHQCPDQQLELSVATELTGGKLDVRANVASAKQPLFDASAKADLAFEPALRGTGAPAVSEASALVQLREIDLASLPRLCGLVQGRLSGRIEADALLGSEPKISVQLRGKKVGFDGSQGVALDVRASATPAEAMLDLGLDHGDTRSTISGRLPIRWHGSELALLSDQPISAQLVLERLPMMALLPPSLGISRASGHLNGSVTASGTLHEPRVRGWIEPEGVALTVTGLAQPLHGIDGRVSFSNRRIVIERLVAKDRGGSVTLKGAAELAKNDDVTAKLSIKADGFPLRQQGQIAGEVDAQIDVVARSTEAKTRVEIKMVDASAWLLGGRLRRGISLDAHPDIRDPRAAVREVELGEDETDTPARPIEISINAEDSFWVRRDDFAVKLSTKIELRIENGEVSATGPIRIHRGYLQLFGQTFDIDGKSKVDLTGGTPSDPVLDITADTLNRASGKTITVNIGGRASAPELTFFIDDVEANAGEAATAMFGRRGTGGDSTAEGEAKSFVAGMMAGVMAMSARRELGDAMPILMIEPADDMVASRIRAGFELDKLVPGFLEGMIRGVYVEGIFAGSNEDANASSRGVQGGVLLELYLPHSLVTSGQYGPGETWSIDLGWEP